MILTLFAHQWKSFWRSRSAGKNIAAQLFIAFMALYLLAGTLALGVSLRYLLPSFFPGEDPIAVFCGIILYYFAVDILVRFVWQELPILTVQPYLIQNIRRRQLVSFLTFRSLFHFLNLLPLLFFLPFVCKSVAAAYGPPAASALVISILSLIVFNHFITLYIKRKTILHSGWLIGFLGVVGIFVLLDHFRLFSLRALSSTIFAELLHKPWLTLLFVALGITALINNTRFLRRHLYVEDFSRRGKAKQSTEYGWLQQRGVTGQLIALEIKLILRNKRPRSVVLMAGVMLLYGFFVFRSVFLHPLNIKMLLCGSMLITGIFIINYGQFLFAWNGSYFDGLMAANITPTIYIRSKFLLLTAISTVSFVITSLYGLMSWQILPIELAAFLYNIGVSSVVTIYLATRSYKSVDLSKGTAFNYQGASLTQFINALVILAVPLLIYGLLAWLINPWTGIILLGAIGLVSLLLQQGWISLLTSEFIKRKHRILEGFRER